MKPHLSLLALLLCTAFAAIGKPRAPVRLHLQVHYTPLIVVGSLVECGFDPKIGNINGRLKITTLLKGDAKTPNLLEVDFRNDYESLRFPVRETIKPLYKKGQTKVFFLYKNRHEKWEISGFSLNYTKKNIGLVTKTVTVEDFKAGIALFDTKYANFEQKQVEKTSFILENTAKNQTFEILAKEMLGDLVEIPKKKQEEQPNKPLPPKPLYLRIHQTPTIVFGALSRASPTEGLLVVSEKIKGSPKKGDKMTIAVPQHNRQIRSPVSNLFTMKINGTPVTDIYLLYQNDDKQWEISKPFEGSGLKINEKQQISFLKKTVSLIDFKIGVALFEEKYTYFQTKLSGKTKFTLENPVKNQTFEALAKEMLDNLLD